MAHRESALLVALVGGSVVGALIAGWDGWRGNMYRLAVLPEHRRSGVGSRLVEAGHDLLLEHGARRVTALVAQADAPARQLWQTLGYDHDEHVVRFVRDRRAVSCSG